ncbi:MAG TPA: baseplate J/gp47 family protein [Nevskiaceae bacterium]|nr:baseplate J/gp47 family protein [Nevskiaceae bacterium]
MSTDRPSLAELNDQVKSDMVARLDGATPTLRRSIFGAIAGALAGALNALYGYADNLAKQCNPATATGKFLELWASLWAIVRKLASAAAGDVVVTGIAGTPVPAGSQLASELGVTYATDDDAVIDGGGSITVSVSALTAGIEGNLDAGATLSFVSPLTNVDVDATVDTAGLAGGADIETDDALRSRMFQRIQNPPHGGNKADYESWARSVAGITRAWVFPLYSGVGTVRVYVANDDYVGANTASAGDVANVQAYIDSVKPVGVTKPDTTNGFEAVAAVKTPVAINLTISPDTPENRQAVADNLAEMFFRRAEPEGTVRLHWVQKAIITAGTVDDYTLSAPSADSVAASGHICTLGTITWP